MWEIVVLAWLHGHLVSKTYDKDYHLYSDCKRDLALMSELKPRKGDVVVMECQPGGYE